MNLSNRALLVTLAISQWTARKFDKRETQAVAAKHGTPAEVARVNKRLLAFSDTLDAIHKKTGEIRTEYYRRTLPWGQHGVNVLKVDGYMEFAAVMAGLMSDWRHLVDKFLADYPALRERDRQLLNGLFDENDYPDVSQVREKFKIDVAFCPIPEESDWRVALSADEMDRLKASITEKVTNSMSEAMREAWRRVHELVTHAHERLADPKAVFRDTLVSNAQELCRLLTTLNIADDPNLEKIRNEIEGSLCQHTPDTLRQAPEVREQVSDKLAEIMKQMGAFYGA